jgi:hypothetical protein
MGTTTTAECFVAKAAPRKMPAAQTLPTLRRRSDSVTKNMAATRNAVKIRSVVARVA